MKDILKTIWPLVKNYKYKLIGLMFLGAMISALRGVGPEILKSLTESWERGDFTNNIKFPMAIGICYLLSSILRYFQASETKFISEIVASNLRINLMEKYLSFDQDAFNQEDHGTGGLISRISNEIASVQFGIHKISDLVREPFMSVFMLAYLLFLDWKLSLFVFITLPVAGKVLGSVARSIRKYTEKSHQDMEEITKTLKESLDGAKIVKSFNLQDFLLDKFKVKINDFLKNRRRVVNREEVAGPIIEVVGVFCFITIFIYIGSQIQTGKISVAHVLGFIMAIAMLQDSLKRTQLAYVALQQAVASLNRYFEVMKKDIKVKDLEKVVSFPKEWDSIKFEDVTFSYDKNKKLLQCFNFEVKRGEVVALVGASGSGKSTIVNLIQRFFDPLNGKVLIGDEDLKSIKLKSLKDNIALVSQDIFLFNDSVKENIRSGKFDATEEEIVNAAKMANADKFISAKPDGYDTKAGDAGVSFSGGEKQRISIARAILKNAPILILDEATSALDTDSEVEVIKGMKELMQGKTVITIAHRLSTITHADRILVLEKGKIIEEGKHEELIAKKGAYQKLYSMQM